MKWHISSCLLTKFDDFLLFVIYMVEWSLHNKKLRFLLIHNSWKTEIWFLSITCYKQKENTWLLKIRSLKTHMIRILKKYDYKQFLCSLITFRSVCVLRCGQSWRKCKLLMITITENIYLFPTVGRTGTTVK